MIQWNLFQSCIDLVLASRDIDGVSSSIRAFRRPPPEPGLFSSRPVKSQQGSFISSQYSCISVLLLLNCKNLLLPVFDLSNLSRILSGSIEICFQIISFFNSLIFDVISSLELNSVQRLNFLEKAFKFSEWILEIRFFNHNLWSIILQMDRHQRTVINVWNLVVFQSNQK